jgi:dTDP-4-dehydrorhamnose 3,5-epimerase-like enzyme
MSEPKIIQGNSFIDDRGRVGFVNDFNFEGVKRFYTVANFKTQFVRAWHGHLKEAKYLTMARGAAVVAAAKMGIVVGAAIVLDEPERFVLSAEKPQVLYIPAGYANGWMSLTPDATLLVFSTATAEESKADDFRFTPDLFNTWHVEER